jgi:hypothetical protein
MEESNSPLELHFNPLFPLLLLPPPPLLLLLLFHFLKLWTFSPNNLQPKKNPSLKLTQSPENLHLVSLHLLHFIYHRTRLLKSRSYASFPKHGPLPLLSHPYVATKHKKQKQRRLGCLLVLHFSHRLHSIPHFRPPQSSLRPPL